MQLLQVPHHCHPGCKDLQLNWSPQPKPSITRWFTRMTSWGDVQ